MPLAAAYRGGSGHASTKRFTVRRLYLSRGHIRQGRRVTMTEDSGLDDENMLEQVSTVQV
jgi:hypothetical protein